MATCVWQIQCSRESQKSNWDSLISASCGSTWTLITCWWCLWFESLSPTAAALDVAHCLPAGSDTALGSCLSAVPATWVSARIPQAYDETSSAAPSRNVSLLHTLWPEIKINSPTSSLAFRNILEMMSNYQHRDRAVVQHSLSCKWDKINEQTSFKVCSHTFHCCAWTLHRRVFLI